MLPTFRHGYGTGIAGDPHLDSRYRGSIRKSFELHQLDDTFDADDVTGHLTGLAEVLILASA